MAVSADTPEQMRQLRERLGLGFGVVSDTDLEVAEAYGVRQEGQDAALPAVYVLDPARKIVYAHVGTAIVDRPSLDDILETR